MKLLVQSEELRGFDPLLLFIICSICSDTATMFITLAEANTAFRLACIIIKAHFLYERGSVQPSV